MNTIDPGHRYVLLTLDGEQPQTLTFVKRNDPPEKYPGNKDAHGGTTMQSVIRSLLERLRYLQGQFPCDENEACIEYFRESLFLLERRAAKRHGISFELSRDECEQLPMCPVCGHVQCEHDICPLCRKEMRDDWHGVKACFCDFGGKSPTAEEVIFAAENHP